MVIKSKHNWLIYPFFQKYTLYILDKRFHTIKLVGDFKDQNLPMLLLANHVSWWDGFWIMYLNLKVLHRKPYFMMLEEQLKKHWYFNYSGAFSVKKNTQSVIETLKYAAQVLIEPNNMVFMFPQGQIESMHNHHVHFHKGAERIIMQVDKPVEVLFVVNLVEYFTKSKPSLFIHFKSYSGSINHKELELAYNSFFQKAVEFHKKIVD